LRDVRKYDVFKMAHQLALEIYKITDKYPKKEIYGLINQLRRASYSIPMNLAEGGARDSEREFAQFVNVSIGSCEEVRYQLLLSKDLGYIEEKKYFEMETEYETVKKMLASLYRKLNKKKLKQ
jgi:four helix bundle protein